MSINRELISPTLLPNPGGPNDCSAAMAETYAIRRVCFSAPTDPIAAGSKLEPNGYGRPITKRLRMWRESNGEQSPLARIDRFRATFIDTTVEHMH